MPSAGASPTVCTAICPPSSVTRQIAPSRAVQPCEMPAPSNAGPAAVAQQRSFFPSQSAISPFVPMSTSSRGIFPSQSDDDRMPAVMSPPTNADMLRIR